MMMEDEKQGRITSSREEALWCEVMRLRMLLGRRDREIKLLEELCGYQAQRIAELERAGQPAPAPKPVTRPKSIAEAVSEATKCKNPECDKSAKGKLYCSRPCYFKARWGSNEGKEAGA